MAYEYCPNCGAHLEQDAVFCPECGCKIEDDSGITLAPEVLQTDVLTPETDVLAPAVPRCPLCGAEVEEGDRFCLACGAPLEGATVAGAADSAAATPATTTSAPAPAPTPSPASTAPTATQGTKQSNAPYVVIGLLAALLAAAVALLFVFKPWDRAGSSAAVTDQSTASQQAQSDAEAEKQAAEQKAAAEQAEAEAQAEQERKEAEEKAKKEEEEKRQQELEAEEQKWREALMPFYNRLSSYDSRIATCADDFNNNYLKPNISVRQGMANECTQLMSELMNEASQLSSVGVPTSSRYYHDYELIVRCYNDLMLRISTIESAWSISLQYANPSSHGEAIRRPLVNAWRPGTSNNEGYLDYNETYPQIKLN